MNNDHAQNNNQNHAEAQGQALNDSIQLSLPANAAYVSAARLTASSIANRMQLFDIDEIEDIKAGVSEACTFLIKNKHTSANAAFTVVFTVEQDALHIEITANDAIERATQDEMGIMMIRALMDEFEIVTNQDAAFCMRMVKRHQAVSFD